MRVLFDTSVLVAGLVEPHPAHERARPWIEAAKRREIAGIVSAHSLAETYAVLTRFPIRPAISPPGAWMLVRENVLARFKVVALSRRDCVAVLDDASQAGISGGTVYDMVIALAARKAAVDQALTLNESHFRRFSPDLADRVLAP